MPKRRRAFGCTDTPHPSRATRDPPSPSRGEGAPPPNLPLQKGEGRIEYAGKPDLTPLLLPLFQGEAGWGPFERSSHGLLASDRATGALSPQSGSAAKPQYRTPRLATICAIRSVSLALR